MGNRLLGLVVGIGLGVLGIYLYETQHPIILWIQDTFDIASPRTTLRVLLFIGMLLFLLLVGLYKGLSHLLKK